MDSILQAVGIGMFVMLQGRCLLWPIWISLILWPY